MYVGDLPGLYLLERTHEWAFGLVLMILLREQEPKLFRQRRTKRNSVS